MASKNPKNGKAPTVGGGSKGLSITLYATDDARIKEIIAFVLATSGDLITRSEAVRLALRISKTAKASAITAALAEMKKEDGRTTRFAAK
jgi:hypothetical protein